ncbi:ATPase [Streptomyces sp. NBC_01242]|uniref:N-acetylglucosamine kinase n=1 Tax=unclassified Streptomyces TaxID=2593676 RepID=UPI00224E7768|nr:MULTISPECIES: BadF/BadG/BcrA/BcrD ATPase family protein [unclassified Streptomyces]MCX4793759.1 ATPase [Streptomyces sp. NBC_01242]WSJ35176.1 ATPase [Streptomyces sp. NBC_01321]
MSAVRVAGVDVGGTGVRVGVQELGSNALGPRTDRPVPATVGETGLDAAAVLALAVPALEALLADPAADMPPTVDTIAVGATGFALLGGDLRKRLPQALADRFRARRVILASDAVTAYAATLGTMPGAVIAAGTGAVGLGLAPREGWRRADGWGHLLGDEGGGAWIGCEGVKAALRAYDGRPDGSPQLLDALLGRFGPPQRLSGLIQPSPQRAGLLAAFAPDVAACAHDGDARAHAILNRAGRALAETAHAAAPDDGSASIACAGKLFRIGDALLGPFEARLRELRPRIRIVASNGEPLDGALRLAAAAATGAWTLPADDALLVLTHFDNVDEQKGRS